MTIATKRTKWETTMLKLPLNQLRELLKHFMYLKESTILHPKQDVYVLLDERVVIPSKMKKYWDKALNKRVGKLKKRIKELEATKTQKP